MPGGLFWDEGAVPFLEFHAVPAEESSGRG